MSQWFIPNMCIRLAADNFLSPLERYALNVATDAMRYDAAVIMHVPRLLSHQETWSVIREVLLPRSPMFVVVRGYGPNPVPPMDEDDVAPDLDRIHTCPLTLIAVYGRIRNVDDEMTGLMDVLHERFPDASTTPYGRLVRCSPAEYDAVKVVSVVDECLVEPLQTTIAPCDLFPTVLAAAPSLDRFLTTLLELQTAIVQRTKYDVPLTWIMMNGTPTCPEAEEWYACFHDQPLRTPTTSTLPDVVETVIHDILVLITPDSSVLRLHDLMPTAMIHADHGDLITTSILRYADHGTL